jgi:hypothetical protein
MTGRGKLPPTPANRSTILDDDLISKVTKAVAASFGSPVMELLERFGVNLADTVRFLPVTRRCIEARENAGLSIKDVAKAASRAAVSASRNRVRLYQPDPADDPSGVSWATWARIVVREVVSGKPRVGEETRR